MNKNVKLLEEKLKNIKNKNKLTKKITITLSCIIVLLTLYFLMLPARTLDSIGIHTLKLEDNYTSDNYLWKTETEGKYKTYLDLELYFVDTNENPINGKDLTISIGTIFEEDIFAFGYKPLKDDTKEGINLIEEFELEKIAVTNGEYIFDHAEVYVDDSWQTLKSDTSNHHHIWCQNCKSETEPENNDYGFKGIYETIEGSIEYTITENTKYRLIYNFEEKVIDNIEPLNEKQNVPLNTYQNTKNSLDSRSGITFELFNYSGNNTETEINANGLYKYFSFRDSTLTPAAYINAELDADGYGPNRVKVLPKLDSTGNPVFDCQGKCDASVKNSSLGYLFGESTNAKGETTQGVTPYRNINNTLLKTETINGVKYYYYDSNLNAVDFDIPNNRFIVRDYVERGYVMTTFKNETNSYEFLPFNHTDKTNPNIAYDYESESNTKEIDHWYGMTMEYEFFMPKNGQINGNDMIFEFSGDDDVWVFIDDVLVLDLGGTHGSVDGRINFRSGEVSSELNWNGTVGTQAAGTAYSTSISEMFTNAGEVASTEWNTSGTTFKDYTKHTLKFFYLERGAAVANCKIRFNIPVLPKGSLTIQKQFEGSEKYNDDYIFAIHDIKTGMPISQNTPYTIGGVQHYINNDKGEFTLKNNEIAIFQLESSNKYYVEEVSPGTNAISYSCTLDSVNCEKTNKTEEFTIDPESTHQVIFTNKTKTYNLDITKVAENSTPEELFKFKLILKDEFNTSVNVNNLELSFPNGYEVDSTNNGIVTFSLKNGESIIINNIPINTNVYIQETSHDGYQTMIKSVVDGEEFLLTSGDEYTIKSMDGDKSIKVYNTPGVILPETGGPGSHIYLFIGFSLIMLTLIYGYNLFFKCKEGE